MILLLYLDLSCQSMSNPDAQARIAKISNLLLNNPVLYVQLEKAKGQIVPSVPIQDYNQKFSREYYIA